MSFTKLGLNPNILKAIEEQGYTKPTLIQEQAIPKVLEKKIYLQQHKQERVKQQLLLCHF